MAQSDKKMGLSITEAYDRARAPWEAQLSSLQTSYQAKLNELDHGAMDAAAFRQQADALEKEFNDMETYLKNKLEAVRQQFAS